FVKSRLWNIRDIPRLFPIVHLRDQLVVEIVTISCLECSSSIVDVIAIDELRLNVSVKVFVGKSVSEAAIKFRMWSSKLLVSSGIIVVGGSSTCVVNII